MIGRFVNRVRTDALLERDVALIRIATLPVIAAGELLVSHPEQHTVLFWPAFGLASLYALATYLLAGRTAWVRRLDGYADLVLLSALVYTSGGPFSQARFAFFLLPVAAALMVGPRQTALATLGVIGAYMAISFAHPATEQRGNAVRFEFAQGFYLALVGLAAALLSRALAERTGRIAALAASRNRLVAQALDAEDRERRRLAEALHDESVQNLLAIRQELSAAPGNVPDLGFVQSGIDRTVSQLREAVFDLHPYLLEHGGLEAAIRAVAEQHARRAGFLSHVSVDDDAAGMDDQLLFSLARELITNAAKHAEADRLDVTIRRVDGSLQLLVEDDGRGVDADTLRTSPLAGHIGLASCAERVEAVGGDFTVTTRPGEGLTAHVRIPLRDDISSPSRPLGG